jgi:hypothetical protein
MMEDAVEVWVITFPAVFHALRAEKILKGQQIDVKLIPIPRELSGSCEGLAAQLAEADVNKAVTLLTESGVEMVRRGIKISRKY